MSHAQLKEDGTFDHEIDGNSDIEWDSHHLCPAAALTSEEAALFRVVPFTFSPKPDFDPITKDVIENGAIQVEGAWTQQWLIFNLDAAKIAANQAKKAEDDANVVASKIEQLWTAADAYERNYISGVAVGLLTIGVIQGLPKSAAVAVWSGAHWADYFTRKAAITLTSTLNLDFSNSGPMPHSVPELRAELGM